MRLLIVLTVALSQAWFTGCYLAQAALGQGRILWAARPIELVVAERAIPEPTRRLLAAVPAIKAFGQAQGLRPTASYQRYAALDRPAAAWVVQGCAPLSFEVRRWDFPVLGSVPYLGFFDEESARRYATSLAQREHLDVDVRTAAAFSTLGWFRDPVLSTMLGSGEEALGELANVVLHESVHATLYLADQSAFDESLASFVADHLTLSWLESTAGPAAAETRAWAVGRARAEARAEQLHRTYLELEAVYRSSASDQGKLAAKARLLAAAGEAASPGRPLNNASLAGFRTYAGGAAAFGRLLARCGGSWPAMLSALSTLRPGDFARLQQDDFDDVVDRVAAGGCRPPPGDAPRASS